MRECRNLDLKRHGFERANESESRSISPTRHCGVYRRTTVDSTNLTTTAVASATASGLINAAQAKPSQTDRNRLTRDAISRRTLRLERMKNWRPSVSHPCLSRDFTLSSVYAQRLFSMTFFRAQIAVYGVTVMLPIICSQEQCRQFDLNIENLLKDAITRLSVETKQLEKIKEDNGVSGAMTYTDPMETSVGLYTPEAGRFLALLTGFDRIAILADELWMCTTLTKDQRNQVIFKWRNILLRISREINLIQVRAKAAISRHKAMLAKNEMRRMASLIDPAVMGNNEEEMDTDAETGLDDLADLGISEAMTSIAAAGHGPQSSASGLGDISLLGDLAAAVQAPTDSKARTKAGRRLPAASDESLMSSVG